MAKLTSQQDASGQAMWDYASGNGDCEIVERDDGLVVISDGLSAYLTQYENRPDRRKEAAT